MQEKVLSLWECKKAEVFSFSERKKLSEKEGMIRSVHVYARSQCRTTHKRQDC